MSTRRSTVKVDIVGDATQLQRAMARARSATDDFNKNLKKDSDTLQRWSRNGVKAIAGFAAAIAGLVLHGGISRALNIEDAQAKLRGLGHDAESVTTIMESALNAVRGTAYGLDTAATTAATAVAAGIAPGKELERYLRLTADAATIAGVGMGEMGAILNKTTTAGRVFTMELNQLADRGLPVFAWLQEAYGVSAAELRKMVSSGEIDAERFRQILEEKIGGAALSSGDTTRGAFANMRAAMSRLGEVFAGDFLPIAKTTFEAVRDGFDQITDRIRPLMAAFHDSGGTEGFERWLEGLPDLMGRATDGFIALWDQTAALRQMLGFVVAGGAELVRWVHEFNTALGGVPAAVAAVAAALKLLYAHPLIAGLGLLLAGIGAITKQSRDAKKAAEEWATALDRGADAVGDHTREVMLGILEQDRYRAAMDHAGLTADDLKAAIEGDADALDKFNSALEPSIRGFSRHASAIYDLNKQLDSNARGLATARAETESRAEAVRRATRADEQAAANSKQFRDALSELTAAQLGTKKATDDTTAAIEEQQATLRELTDPVFAAMNAIRRLEEAQQALEAAQNDSTTSAADLEAAQLAVVQAFIELDGAGQKLSAENIDAFATTAAQALGISKDQALELIGALDRLDGRTVAMDIVTRWRESGAPPPGVTATGSISFRAGGGPVTAGTPYRVGEGDRPELLMIPGENGRVFNESQLSALGGGPQAAPATVINLTVNALDPDAAARAVVESLQRWTDRNGPLPFEVAR